MESKRVVGESLLWRCREAGSAWFGSEVGQGSGPGEILSEGVSSLTI